MPLPTTKRKLAAGDATELSAKRTTRVCKPTLKARGGVSQLRYQLHLRRMEGYKTTH